MLTAWNNFLANIHNEGQTTGNQVPNLSVKVLAETEIFDGHDSFPAMINREFRILFGNTLDYRLRMEGFLADISANWESTVTALQQCDRRLEEDLASEIEVDLERAGRC